MVKMTMLLYIQHEVLNWGRLFQIDFLLTRQSLVQKINKIVADLVWNLSMFVAGIVQFESHICKRMLKSPECDR